MAFDPDNSAKIMEGLKRLLADQSSASFLDFAEVAEALVDGYARLIRNGSPAPTVALAMLGATVNVYDMFGMRSDLPALLRTVADQIESESPAN